MSLLTRRAAIAGAASALAAPALARTITASDIDRIQVRKGARKLELIGPGRRLLRGYDMRLGRNPIGHKRFQRDARTPEGAYRINRRNPNSRFYLSLGIDYPNARDIAYARARGRSPGGDIFIHGQRNGQTKTEDWDWTWGCMAVSNAAMDELWQLIEIGCPVLIYP